jgi:hypothetical protein
MYPYTYGLLRIKTISSKQQVSKYLQEIGDIVWIPKSKSLVTHLARKTFATTIALTNGMNIGVLSKIFFLIVCF